MNNELCCSCGRWSTNRQHCYNAVIALLAIKRYTNKMNMLDKNIVKMIALKVLESASNAQWQNACMTARWMNGLEVE